MIHDYSSNSRLLEFIYKKVYADKKLFESLRPAEYKRLTELIDDPVPGVKLVSGDFHKFNIDELRKLHNRLPWYLRGLVLLPFVFVYKRENYYAYYKLITPSRWTKRVISYILNGDYTKEVNELKPNEMMKLLREFKTLTIILIEVNV
jgi:uncharacterized protein (UPF0216 family)